MHIAEDAHVIDEEALVLDWGLETLKSVPRHISWEEKLALRNKHWIAVTYWMAIRVPSATRMKS